MKKLATLLVLLCIGVSFSQQQYSKVKIFTNKDGLKKLAQLGVPVDHGIHKPGVYFISDFSEEEIYTMAINDFEYEVLIKDVKKYYRERNERLSTEAKNATCSGGASSDGTPVNFDTDPNSYAGFYKYQEMLDELDDMVAQYPNLISVKAPISTFQTWQGRPIYHVKISDNPSTDEASETKVLYTAIHHAREPMSMSQTIYYMWYLLENYASNEEIQFLVNNTEMYFVPCINPDGYLINESNDPGGFGMHRKNGRPIGTSNPGVDLNRNYSYGWGTTGVSFDPDNDTYPGGPNDGTDYSFSEPETQAIKWLCENVNFTSAFNAHTYGNTLLHPIGTTSNEFADHHDYFTDLSGHMCSKNGYLPQKSSGLYPASGDSDDYMYKEDIGVGQRDTIFAMTPEVGSGFWPAQSEVIPTCHAMVFPNMVLSHMTHKYYDVKDTDANMVNTLTGNFNHDALRLGLEDGTVTVSLEPLLNILSVGSPIVYNLALRETTSGAISYTLNPGIGQGAEIKYILKTDYGVWTKRDTIVKYYGIPSIFDDATTTTNWTGTWNTTNQEFYSPSRSFTDSPNTNYGNNESKTYEYNQTIDLSNAAAASVSFYAKWEVETDYDYVQFQVSTDGGANWIGQCGNYTVDGNSANGSVQPDGEPIYEGIYSNWVLEEVDLSDYLGETVQLRFIFESDGAYREDGFYFDDFTVRITENSSASIDAIENLNVMVYPNPTNGTFTIEGLAVGTDIKIMDEVGRVVFSGSSASTSEKVNVDLQNGNYILKMDGHDEVIKIVLLK